MIFIEDYRDMIDGLGKGYFVDRIEYLPDLASWARENNQELAEPHFPMKLISENSDHLSMIIQSTITEEMLENVITGLGIRWSLRDNKTDIDRVLNSTKKKLAYCFLKERSRTMKDIGGDEMIEDRWVLDEMELLGFFKE